MICINVQLRVFPLQKMLKTCMTPLIIASRKGDHKIIKQLLKAGARPDVRGPDGKTALVVALEEGQSECVALLIKAGADVNIDCGDTSLLNSNQSEDKTSQSGYDEGVPKNNIN